jgi:Rieske Fe-S protein
VYDALTGKNVAGPAPRPLAAFAVRVKAGEVVADQQ